MSEARPYPYVVEEPVFRFLVEFEEVAGDGSPSAGGQEKA